MDPYGLTAELLAGVAGVSRCTALRWKRLGRIPPAASRLVALAIEGELGAIDPAWRGFHLVRGQLWTPYGFGVAPSEISALTYRFAQLCELQRALAEPQQWALFGSLETYTCPCTSSCTDRCGATPLAPRASHAPTAS